MSVCVTIRTKKIIEPTTIFDSLVEKGEKIVVTCPNFPSVKFGNHLKAIRGVEVNQEENGYEIRICTYASVADYELFVKTIVALTEITLGKAYYNDEDPVDNPVDTFDSEWIEKERESSFMVTRALINQSGHPVVLYGLFCRICIGAKLYSDFDIPLSGEYDKEYMDTLQNHLCSVQWHFANLKDTSTRMVLPSPSGDEREAKTISMICIKDGKVNEFDLISEASLLGIMDMDNKDNPPVLIPFHEAWKILPEVTFRPVDEWQYERKEELTADMVRQMMENARRLQPDDLHYAPTAPGEGFDENQNTFILTWNPAISSVTLEDHNYGVKNMLTEYFNWSVWDYKEAKCGDRFFLVRVGDGNTGIVMSGVFDSQPYEAGDWSGKGRRVFYMDMIPNVILNPETAPMITTEQLKKAIPSFDWSGGHSGRLLTKEEAQLLEKMWQEYIEANTEHIDGVNLNAVVTIMNQ